MSKMVDQKRNNSEENIVQAKRFQLVDLKSYTSFCTWKEDKLDSQDEEQLQNSTKTKEIPCFSETEGEPQSSNENKEFVSLSEELHEYLDVEDEELKNLYKCFYSSGNTCIQSAETVVSHETNTYTFKLSMIFSTLFEEFKFTLKPNTINNNTDNAIDLYLYRNNHGLAFSHENIDEFRNLKLPLRSDNINVVNWVHRINYFTDLAKDPIIKQNYPGYGQVSFIVLFCQYLSMSDTLLKAKMNISKYDLLTVYLEESWLNDQVINKYFALIKARSNAIEDKNIHVFDSFFFTQFVKNSYNHVKNHTKKIDIFSFKKLMIPVNTGGHWVLICYDALSKSLVYYDSVKDRLQFRQERVESKVVKYLKLEHKARKGVDFNDDGLYCLNGRSPVQTNSYDCGVFTCINGELFSRDEPSYNSYEQTHINVYRQKITHELLNNELITQ